MVHLEVDSKQLTFTPFLKSIILVVIIYVALLLYRMSIILDMVPI